MDSINNVSIKNFNIINYIKIIDLSILNLLDYSDISNVQYSHFDNESNKIIIDINAESKKLLEGFIINNINNELYYNRMNIIINTCNPMKNWRQYERKKALRNNKCFVHDESIYIDEVKLNNFLNSIFEKLPMKEAVLVKRISFKNNTISSNISIPLNENIKFLEFNDVDFYDIDTILKHYLSNIGNLLTTEPNYIIIKDGNYNYSHKDRIPGDIWENVRLQLLEKGII